MRQVLKTVDNKPCKFVPTQDAGLSESAPEIKNRPLVVMHRKLTREDRLNMRGLIEFEERMVDGQAQVVALNIGSVAKYIWENCVIEVLNVLTQDGEFESVKGKQKDDLFATEGMDNEIMETIKHIQDVSSFTEAEAKN